MAHRQVPGCGRLAQFGCEHVLEPSDHEPHERGGISTSRQRIRVGEEIAFEVFGGRVEVPDGRRILGGLDERRARAEPVRLEYRRHVRDGQSLWKGDVDDVDIPANKFVDHLERRHRSIEPVLAGFEMTTLSRLPQGETESQLVADDAALDESVADGAAACARWKIE